MDSALPLLLFLAFLFGSMLLILVTGIQSRERERREEAEEAPGLDAVVHSGPRFFARLGPVDTPAVAPAPLWDGMHAHLQSEWRIAAGFVVDPCLESLYRRTHPEVEALVADIQRYLAGERRQASIQAHDFVSPVPRAPLDLEPAMVGRKAHNAQRPGGTSR